MEAPLPIAALLRRARNAKSPKERHDTAYFAWEASLRLAVAARPPADPAVLAMASLGHWVGAFQGNDAPLDRPALLAAFAVMAEFGLGKEGAPKAVTAKELLEPLAAYRNQLIGHGSTRAADFYERAAGTLVDGLEAAWAAGVFWPAEAQLVFVDVIEIDAAGARRARVLQLRGLNSIVETISGATAVPDGVLPRRVYLRNGGAHRSLHPWLLYQEAELRERVLFFNGRGRTSQFLDYVSGEALKGKALGEAFPALDADLDALFTRAHAPVPRRAPSERREAEVPRQAQDERTEAADPSRFGDYRLLGKLGQGGMGVVYLARQEGLGRVVALKMLPIDLAQDPVAVARFRREVSALSRCDHPNVVKIHASGEAQGTRYYAMELVLGADLAQVAEALSSAGDDDFDGAVSTASERVRRAGADAFAHIPDLSAAGERELSPAPIAGRAPDRPRRLAALFRDAARGVQHLHEVGVIHRDLKPGNLMVTAADHRVVVMDLGLAALGDTSKSITRDRSALLGTLRYMPPEQLQRNLVTLDRRADVYSLGATLYELVTGRRLFDGDSEARLIEQVLRETPAPAEKASRGVPRDLSVIIQKATEKDPARRYDSAAALAADLDEFLEGRPISARSPSLGYVLRLAIARNRGLATVIAAAIVLAVTGTAFFVAREGRLRREAEEQRVRAEKSESEAIRQRAEAVRLGLLAREREEEAQVRLEEIRRLSDVKVVADYEQAADELWPAAPENVTAMARWLEGASELAGRLPQHRKKLEEIRAAALPWDDAARAKDRATHPAAERLEALGDERAARSAALDGALGSDEALEQELTRIEATARDLEQIVSERRTYAFESDQSRWEHDTLAGLVARLERFSAAGATTTAESAATPAGAMASVRSRLAFAATIRARSIDDRREEWTECIAAIADVSRNPQYRGLRIRRQVGLAPIGRDPESRLFEFAHLETGDPPARGSDGKLILREETGIVFVLLPGGTFRMGAAPSATAFPGETNIDPSAQDDEGPPHDHAVEPFLLSKYEMTQGQWHRFAGTNPSQYRPGSVYGAKPVTLLNPVEQVDWHDATRLLRRLGLRLPSEAEWEYAARAGTTTVYYTGNDSHSLEGAVNIADHFGKSDGDSSWTSWEDWLDDGCTVHAPVGSFRPNDFGLHDVLGNVDEWCSDAYDERAYQRFASGDLSPSRGRYRVLRGGSWNVDAKECRSALRLIHDPSYRFLSLGLRPASRVTTE